MKISEKLFNNLVAFFIVVCGVYMSYGLYTDETNIILCFGFSLVALVMMWSSKK